MVYLAKTTTRRLRIEEWVMPAAEPTTKPVPNLPPGFDFTDPDIYAERLPIEELAEMRRTAPIWWNEQPMGIGGFADGGFWVVTKHQDVKDVSHHTHLRKIVSRAFTPRAIERLREDLYERAQNIVKAAAAEGSGDFVEQISCELPLQAIAALMGVPQEDRMKLFHWSNQMVGDMDPEFAGNDAIAASVELIMYGMKMAAERADQPGEDLVTKLVQ